ncbi:hypothetical protein E2320_014648 [Naja naja]|nr:hypothetical protein E2320_014648 [Naja naja]
MNPDIFCNQERIPGKITDAETDSGIYDPLATSEVTTDANRTRNADRVRIPQCISDRTTKILLTYSIIATIAIIVLIVMLVKKESCPICALCESFACPEVWHRYKGKYYYVSEKQRSWNMSLEICSSYNASLIAIDTQQELDHLGEVFNLHDYWIGLSKTDQVWKWSNGTVFIEQFPVEGEGACAYINRKGANSTICSVEKRFICSIPKHCPKLSR